MHRGIKVQMLIVEEGEGLRTRYTKQTYSNVGYFLVPALAVHPFIFCPFITINI